jgi:ATP-dependent exoDNAse (exonuclease V) alpha subunit
MRRAPDLVALGQDTRGDERFTTRDMLEAEQRLHRAAMAMAERARHGVDARDRDTALARAEARGLILSAEQAEALAYVTDGRDLGIVIGHAGTGKSAMLGVAREAWEAAGYNVAARRCRASRPRTSRADRGSPRAPSQAWNRAGRRGAMRCLRATSS